MTLSTTPRSNERLASLSVLAGWHWQPMALIPVSGFERMPLHFGIVSGHYGVVEFGQMTEAGCPEGCPVLHRVVVFQGLRPTQLHTQRHAPTLQYVPARAKLLHILLHQHPSRLHIYRIRYMIRNTASAHASSMEFGQLL